MFSYEDRIRAVRLYFELGNRSAAARRQLGYPTKNSLVTWVQEFCQRGHSRAGFARLTRKFSEEQKKAAVEHYLRYGRCVSFTLKALGYPGRETLTTWIRELAPQARKYAVGRAGRPAHSLASKRAAVYELCSRQESAQDIAKRLDVDRVTLYKWKNQLLGRDAPAIMKRQKDPPARTETTQLQRQVEQAPLSQSRRLEVVPLDRSCYTDQTGT
jgi:transposase-like protein